MAYTAQDVAKLRESTGAPMMDCKNALVACGGDMEKAAEHLRKQGIASAAKKAGRIASEGVVAAAVSKNGKIGALVEVNCESDFVGKSEPFVKLAQAIAEIVLKENPATLEALLAAKTGSETVMDLIATQTGKIGEKLSLRRFARQEIKSGLQESYIHMFGKIGVLLEVETGKDLNKNKDFVALCHEIAMHIAGIAPQFVYTDEIPSEIADKEREILLAQMEQDEKIMSKPEAVRKGIIDGKIKKYFKEICLVEQEFFKDPSVTVGKLVENAAKTFGTAIKIIKFTKFIMGEGLEKKSENLAEEVAKLQG